MADISSLYSPFSYKNLHLRNRIVMAPMTRCRSANGIPSADVARYYERRAEGEVGLIISEGTVINRPAAHNHPNEPYFYGEVALSAWKNVIDSVHKKGGKMAPQLWHVGSSGLGGLQLPGVESPSGMNSKNIHRGKSMTEQDIADTISAFADAARNAKRLGFDTLEIHGAHGYLIDEFFWGATNLRTDSWGGATLSERTKFAREVIRATRKAVGEDFPIILRISQWKEADFDCKLAKTPREMEAWLSPLVDAGVDILHCSQRRFWEPEFPQNDSNKGLNFAGWAKKITGQPTISVGSVGLSSVFNGAFIGEGSRCSSLQNLAERMDKGEFDLIAIGRALLQDPNWALKTARGQSQLIEDFTASSLKSLWY